MRSVVVAAVAAILVALLSACGSNAGAGPERSYSLDIAVDDSEDRYRYTTTDEVDIRVGDEVTFELTNTGTLIHDLQVVDPDGTMLAKAEPTAPGQDASVTVRFEDGGIFRLNCLVDDHLIAHEMQTFIEVTEPTG